MEKVKKTGYVCLRCRHITYPRDNKPPLRCGGCKSPYWWKEFDVIGRAHVIVQNAIKKGTIVKPKKCSLCGGTKRISAHHQDYNEPLDIEWLCHSCHINFRHSKKKGEPWKIVPRP